MDSNLIPLLPLSQPEEPVSAVIQQSARTSYPNQDIPVKAPSSPDHDQAQRGCLPSGSGQERNARMETEPPTLRALLLALQRNRTVTTQWLASRPQREQEEKEARNEAKRTKYISKLNSIALIATCLAGTAVALLAAFDDLAADTSNEHLTNNLTELNQSLNDPAAYANRTSEVDGFSIGGGLQITEHYFLFTSLSTSLAILLVSTLSVAASKPRQTQASMEWTLSFLFIAIITDAVVLIFALMIGFLAGFRDTVLKGFLIAILVWYLVLEFKPVKRLLKLPKYMQMARQRPEIRFLIQISKKVRRWMVGRAPNDGDGAPTEPPV